MSNGEGRKPRRVSQPELEIARESIYNDRMYCRVILMDTD